MRTQPMQFVGVEDSVELDPVANKADRAASTARDALAIVGGLLVVAGVWLVYIPAALIVAGSLLLTAAIVGARRA